MKIPPVNVYITMEHITILMGTLTISMAMFNSDIKLPKGSHFCWVHIVVQSIDDCHFLEDDYVVINGFAY